MIGVSEVSETKDGVWVMRLFFWMVETNVGQEVILGVHSWEFDIEETDAGWLRRLMKEFGFAGDAQLIATGGRVSATSGRWFNSETFKL